MAKTLANLLTDILKRANLKADDRKSIKAILDESEVSNIEIEDEDYSEIMGNIHNLETAENQLKPKIQAETLNGVDASILEILGEGLTDDQKDKIKSSKKTAEKLRLGFDSQINNLKEKLKVAKKDGDKGEEEILRAEIAKLNNQSKDLKESYDKQINDLQKSHKSEIFGLTLNQKISSRADIADDMKSNRHFAQNFNSDLNEYLTKNGIEIDFSNGTPKLIKSDTKTEYLDKNLNKVDFDGIIGIVVKDFGYEKKSQKPDQQKVEVSLEGKSPFEMAIINAQKANSNFMNP